MKKRVLAGAAALTLAFAGFTGINQASADDGVAPSLTVRAVNTAPSLTRFTRGFTEDETAGQCPVRGRPGFSATRFAGICPPVFHAFPRCPLPDCADPSVAEVSFFAPDLFFRMKEKIARCAFLARTVR